MDTRKLLEELENVINSANEVPFTNKKMVDKDEIERLIDAINQSLPNALESARRIVADKERIMLDAEKKAEDTVAQAKDYIARITEESELGAGEMCLYYNAATKKCYMLVGPQCAGVEGANLFAMNEAGTDKVLFTNADQNEVGIYLNNVSTKYVVALPVKKDEMLVDIYNKGNIDQIESASKHNSVKFFKEKQYAIPGEYNTTLGYNLSLIHI